MVKIEAIIRPCMLDEVKAALESIGVEYVTSSEVHESGGRSTYRAVYRGAEYRVDEPRMKLEILACSDRTDELVEMLSGTARTRTSGRRRRDYGLPGWTTRSGSRTGRGRIRPLMVLPAPPAGGVYDERGENDDSIFRLGGPSHYGPSGSRATKIRPR